MCRKEAFFMKSSIHSHQPVMVCEILSYATFEQTPSGSMWMLDATLGRGGHTQAFKNQHPNLRILALDRDFTACQYGLRCFQNDKDIFIHHSNFHNFERKKAIFMQKYGISKGFNWIIMDLGPSSPQLLAPERGFSFYNNGPLDMRMDQSEKLSADEIIHQWSFQQLTALFRECGDVSRPIKVVQAILREREKKGIKDTKQLAQIIEKAQGWRKKGRHPAAPYFLALRIAVNNELNGLVQSLPVMINSLKEKGRIFVLSFHSLEDRIVKNIFKEQALKKKTGRLVNKKVLRPSREEVVSNPNSRSACLRIFEKTVE